MKCDSQCAANPGSSAGLPAGLTRILAHVVGPFDSPWDAEVLLHLPSQGTGLASGFSLNLWEEKQYFIVCGLNCQDKVLHFVHALILCCEEKKNYKGAAWVSWFQWGWDFSSGMEFPRRLESWIHCRNVLSCCRLQHRWSEGAMLFEREIYRRLWRLEHKAVLSHSLCERAGLRVPVLYRMEVLICRIQPPCSSPLPFPLSKHVCFHVLCRASFWFMPYLCWLGFPAFQTEQHRIIPLCPWPPFFFFFQLSVILNLEMCSSSWAFLLCCEIGCVWMFLNVMHSIPLLQNTLQRLTN